mmetsp:Transcript_24127/g.44833  ORF Transcript_24127/g.44833 Transcript_24127/m.44833 type:complete len:228 (+) Transcript_24127:2537-3220(+)
MGQPQGGVGHLKMVGMHKIGVIPRLHAIEHRVRGVQNKIVPAHVGHFQGRISWGNRHDFTADPIKPWRVAVFTAPCGHQLHANTDAQKRATLDLNRLDQRVIDAPCPAQGRRTGRKGTVAGQHNPVGPRHDISVRCDHNRARIRLPRHPLKSLVGRVQIATFVVDQGRKAHSAPLVEGIAFALRGSTSNATRKARATDLNAASAMWWLFSPCSISTCRVIPPWVASA